MSALPTRALEQHLIVLGRAAPTVMPNDLDKAYAAGFFDGEGNICIAVNWHGGKAGKYPVYNMRIGAAQVEPEPLLWLRQRWGGSVRRVEKPFHHHWGCFSRMAATFLRDVVPYLMTKRERAELALKFQASSFQPGRAAHSEEHKLARGAMKAQMNRLNLHQPRMPT